MLDLLWSLLDESTDAGERELREPDDGLLGALVDDRSEKSLEGDRMLESEL